MQRNNCEILDVESNPNNYDGHEEVFREYDQKGLVVVFTFRNITSKLSRNIFDKDIERLYKCFSNYNFEVRRNYNNLLKRDVTAQLRALSREDFSNQSSLIVIILSQGGLDGNLYTPDGDYLTSGEIWSYFTCNKCPSLRGKPKIFIFEACKHLSMYKFIMEKPVYQPDFSRTYTLPTEPDMLIAYSTVEGNSFERMKFEGSWYIQELCSNIEKYAHREDFLSILTYTSQSTDHKIKVLKKKYIYKQKPCLLSTLTKKFYVCKNNQEMQNISNLFEQYTNLLRIMEEIKKELATKTCCMSGKINKCGLEKDLENVDVRKRHMIKVNEGELKDREVKKDLIKSNANSTDNESITDYPDLQENDKIIQELKNDLEISDTVDALCDKADARTELEKNPTNCTRNIEQIPKNTSEELKSETKFINLITPNETETELLEIDDMKMNLDELNVTDNIFNGKDMENMDTSDTLRKIEDVNEEPLELEEKLSKSGTKEYYDKDLDEHTPKRLKATEISEKHAELNQKEFEEDGNRGVQRTEVDGFLIQNTKQQQQEDNTSPSFLEMEAKSNFLFIQEQPSYMSLIKINKKDENLSKEQVFLVQNTQQHQQEENISPSFLEMETKNNFVFIQEQPNYMSQIEINKTDEKLNKENTLAKKVNCQKETNSTAKNRNTLFNKKGTAEMRDNIIQKNSNDSFFQTARHHETQSVIKNDFEDKDYDANQNRQKSRIYWQITLILAAIILPIIIYVIYYGEIWCLPAFEEELCLNGKHLLVSLNQTLQMIT